MPSVEEVIARLRLICGEPYVLSSPAALCAYSRPGLQSPAVVVIPGTVTEVAAAVTACNAAQVAFTVRGAGTTALAPDPVLIALARLRRIVTVDAGAATITAEAGVPLAALRRAMPAGFPAFPAPEASPSATVGGWLARGFGRSSLLGLELVSAGGAIVCLERDAAGYDLAGAFVGSRGHAGIAVRARLRAAPVIAAENDRGAADDA
jgi:glycolate oxidase